MIKRMIRIRKTIFGRSQGRGKGGGGGGGGGGGVCLEKSKNQYSDK